MISYNIDENNHINYEFIYNFVVIKYVFYYDISTLQQFITQYHTYIAQSNPQTDFVTTYPGTTDPFLIESHLKAMDTLGLLYRVHLEGDEVNNISSFRSGLLNSFVQRSKVFMRRNQLQSACTNEVSQFCKSEGFPKCALTTQLRPGPCVDSLIRYYEIDSANNFIAEYSNKPDSGNIYHSIRLREKFATRKIKLVDGKLKYYPKD